MPLAVMTGKKMQDRSQVRALVILGGLFFIFGFTTWLGSVLIPYLKIACRLNNFQSYLVAFSFYISYFIMALPSAWVLKKTGLKKGMSLGLAVMAIGMLIFLPAALSRQYFVFLLGLFVQGAGLAVLQTASNPYVTILGPRESAAKRISAMGICNGIAGIIAPIILGSIILEDADGIRGRLHLLSAAAQEAELNSLANRVILPYSIMAAALLILSVVIYYSPLPEIDTEFEESEQASSHKPNTSIFHFPHLLVGAFTLFLYVGVEVLAGDSIIAYGSSQGIATSIAKFFTSGTLFAMFIGYIVGIICIPKYFSQEQALKVSAILGITFTLASIATSGYLSVLFIALLGLANSLMWPSIWPLAIADLGRFMKLGSSLLIMAIGGGAVLPLLYGYLADRFNPQEAYWMLIPCYCMIFYFAVKGHKLRRKIKVKQGQINTMQVQERSA